uniref:GH25 family lysozyme n=1 Tax=Arthrobacter sp. H5 TaxID=1267973 RepID=UPI001563DCDD
MRTFRTSRIVAATLLTAAMVAGATPATALMAPLTPGSDLSTPEATTHTTDEPDESVQPALEPAEFPESVQSPLAPTPPVDADGKSGAEVEPEVEGEAEEKAEVPQGDLELDEKPDAPAEEVSPERLARNAEAVAELIGPLGASMGQGLQRIEESGDPQQPTYEEAAQLDAAVSGELDADTKGAFRAPESSAAQPQAASISNWKPAGILGVDVSSHQGRYVDWAGAYREGSRFAYAKATESTTYKNPYFNDQYSGAANAGMVRGAYHFAIPSVSSGATQADYFIKNGGGWSADGKTLPPLLDVEYNPYPSLGNDCYNMSPSQMVNWIRDFSNTMVSRTGRQPMIYTTADWWNRCTGNSTAFANHPLHVASYNTCCAGTLPSGWSTHSVWQYTDRGPVVGDWNRWNGTAAGLTAFARNNSSSSTPPAVVQRSLAAVNAGDFNRNGTDDLVSRRVDGTLWFHDGTGNGTFQAPVRIGSGWDIYSQLVGGQDFNNDGRTDLIGRKTDGTLWF